MENEKKEYVMSKKEAQSIVEGSQKMARRYNAYFRDSVAKAFLYMKDNVDKSLDFYANEKFKGISKEWQEEIVKIFISFKDMIVTQCDIVFNGENAKAFNYEPLTVKDLMEGKHLGFGFSAHFNGSI